MGSQLVEARGEIVSEGDGEEREIETHRERYKDKELQSLSVEEHCCI